MSIVTLRSEREIAFAVNEIVKEGYEEKFSSIRRTLSDHENMPNHYQEKINGLVEEAAKKLANIIARKKNIDVGMLIRAIFGLDIID